MGKLNTALTVVIVTYLAMISVWYPVSAPLDHDEHQFMASAFMVARYGLLPYRDFAYFHMPDLVYLYAPFFFIPYPFVAARLFVGICALAICLMIFFAARNLFAGRDKLNSLVVPASSAALLIQSPLFAHASSHVWNHMPSTVCAVLAFFLHCRAIRGDKPLRYFFLSGVSLGAAIGIRLSFTPLVVPFLFAVVVFRGGAMRDHGLNAAAFALGGLLPNLPAVYFLLTSYQDFWFGNVGYAKLNTIYRQEMSFPEAMTALDKLRQLKNSIYAKPGELLILLTTLYSLILLGIDRARRRLRPPFEILFLLFLLPFAYFGSMAPTPTWDQYYFAPVPFLILLGIYALSTLQYSASAESAGVLLALAALVSFVYSSPPRIDSVVRGLITPQFWTPIRLHQEAERIRAYVDSNGGDGTVLTLSPLYAIESGLPIYREFVTGPFAWRVSHLLADDEAAKRGLPIGSKIGSFLKEKRPRAIVTGKDEKQVEEALVKEAQQLDYWPTVTTTGLVIWLPPK